MEDRVKNTMNIDKNILDLFWKLCNKNTNIRLKACTNIFHTIIQRQHDAGNEQSKDLQYCVERLIKGLASPRDAARLGYSLLLTEILKKISIVTIEEVLELMKKHLTSITKQDRRDIVFGQLFAYSAIVRSRRLPADDHLSHITLSLYDLLCGKSYILNASYEVMLDLFCQLSIENFKEKVWNQLKRKLPTDLENCSAESLWILLLCIRKFPEAVSTKFLTKHYGAEDIFAPENLNHLKRIIKQTSSSLPLLHPLCSEFLLLAKQRKDFKAIWTTVVDDNLFDVDQIDKAFVGFEMIKLALRIGSTRKIVKIVLSPKFHAIFSKSFLSAKHPMNSAANHLAEVFCNFVKVCNIPELQVIILKVFLQTPAPVVLDHILKKKEVSLIIQNLLPDAVKVYCEILKAIFIKKKSNSDKEKDANNMKRCQAVHQIGNLVSHPVTLTDMEWRLDVIKFLFLHSFFNVKEATTEIPHCENVYDNLPDSLRDACMNAFFKAISSLHMRTGDNQSPINYFLQQLISLTEFAELLMNANGNVDPIFSIEKIQPSWIHLKTIVHKLSKQSTKDGQVLESNAFQALFLQLGFHLFQDPEHISEILEELYICCKKALKVRKHETHNNEDGEPPWIGVVVDILLSLLSKSSKNLRSLVTYVFPLFCPFIDCNALQQILDVINPQKEDNDMLIDESDMEAEEDQDIDFGSGSSSDESETGLDTQPIDEEFRKKIQEALGPAADNSDAESVVLSDSEMFKLDDALSHVFKSRMKSGHTQMQSEEKTLLNFRVRCFDLILTYLKSEPPMHLVLMCIEPILAAFELGHHNKHQSHLLQKALSSFQLVMRIRKFEHHNNVNKSELKRLLDVLIPKCHKEINMNAAQKLYNICVFIVLCYRKLEDIVSPDKKGNSKIPSYIKAYLSNLDIFISSGSSNMLPQFFTNLMKACPDLSWHFIKPCRTYAFDSNIRLYKKTQCVGLLSEALKYSKGQKNITDDQWLEFGHDVFPLAIESLKSTLSTSNIKPVYLFELLNIIYTSYSIIKEKTGKSLLDDYADLLPLLTDNSKLKKLKQGRKLKNSIIVCLGGNPNNSWKKTQQKSTVKLLEQEKRKIEETESCHNLVNGSESNKKLKHKKVAENVPEVDTNESMSDENSV